MQTTAPSQTRPYFIRQASGGFHEGYITNPYNVIDPVSGKLFLDLYSGPQVNHFQTQAYAGLPTRWGPVVDQAEYGHIPRNRIKSDGLYLHNPVPNRGPFLSTQTEDAPIQAFETLPNSRRLANLANGTLTTVAEAQTVSTPDGLFASEEAYQKFYQAGKASFARAISDLQALLARERANPAGEANVLMIIRDLDIMRQRESQFEASMLQIAAAMRARDSTAAEAALQKVQQLQNAGPVESLTLLPQPSPEQDLKEEEESKLFVPVRVDGVVQGHVSLDRPSYGTGLASEFLRLQSKETRTLYEDFLLTDLWVRQLQENRENNSSYIWLTDFYGPRGDPNIFVVFLTDYELSDSLAIFENMKRQFYQAVDLYPEPDKISWSPQMKNVKQEFISPNRWAYFMKLSYEWIEKQLGTANSLGGDKSRLGELTEAFGLLGERIEKYKKEL